MGRPKLTKGDVYGVLVSHGARVSRIKEFVEWNADHPSVWPLFCATADKLVAQGETRIGAKAIGESIRKSSPALGDFGVNNNYLSYYIRLWLFLNPIFKSKVEMRRLAA